MASNIAMSYESGKGYIVTWERPLAEYSVQLDYLLHNGDRRTVVIDSAINTPEVRHAIGRTLAQDKPPQGS